MDQLVALMGGANGAVSAATSGVSLLANSGLAMANPADLTMTAAKWVLSSAFTSSVGVLGASWAAKALLSHYGDDIVSGLYNTITTELSKLPPSLWGTPPPKREPPPLFSLENAQYVIGHASKHSRALFTLLLLAGLQYLHAVGAYEMRRQVRARIETTPGPLVNHTGGDAKRATYAELAEAAAKAPSTKQDDALLERMLHSLYAQHPFYASGGKAEAAYFTLSGNHPVRMVVNLLLGFLVQLNALLAGGGAIDDPVADMARIASVVAYFELLMRSLRLYGWAPLYVGTSLVARMFAGETPPTGHKRRI
jgi:hypothetical protein